MNTKRKGTGKDREIEGQMGAGIRKGTLSWVQEGIVARFRAEESHWCSFICNAVGTLKQEPSEKFPEIVPVRDDTGLEHSGSARGGGTEVESVEWFDVRSDVETFVFQFGCSGSAKPRRKLRRRDRM